MNWFKLLVMEYSVEDNNPPSIQRVQVNTGQIDQCLDKTNQITMVYRAKLTIMSRLH